MDFVSPRLRIEHTLRRWDYQITWEIELLSAHSVETLHLTFLRASPEILIVCSRLQRWWRRCWCSLAMSPVNAGSLMLIFSVENLSVSVEMEWSLINSKYLLFLRKVTWIWFRIFSIFSASSCSIFLDVDCSIYDHNSAVSSSLKHIIEDILAGNVTTGKYHFTTW